MEASPGHRLEGESRDVFQHRYDEARASGLTRVEAARFAESGVDVGQLRRLVTLGCPPRLMAEIVT